MKSIIDPGTRDKDGCTYLHKAQTDALLSFFVRLGCDPNAQDNEGLTAPMHWLDHFDEDHSPFLPRFEALVSKGHNPRLKDAQGRSLLCYLACLNQDSYAKGRRLKLSEEKQAIFEYCLLKGDSVGEQPPICQYLLGCSLSELEAKGINVPDQRQETILSLEIKAERYQNARQLIVEKGALPVENQY